VDNLTQRLHVLAPALVPAAFFVVGFFLYCGLCLVGRRPEKTFYRERDNVFDFFIHFFIWLLGPLERVLERLKLTPNHLTMAALACCAGSGLAIATRHLSTAAWLYIAAGALDVLDGRLARAKNMTSKSGALLDSVTDRWGELLVFSGFAWFLRDSVWLLAVLLAMAGSIMVSYTRARGESLGVTLSGGIMQRAERIALVSVGTLVTAWFDAVRETAEFGIQVIGVALVLCGVLASVTAIGRWIRGYKMLRAEELAAAGDRASASGKLSKVTVD